MAPQKAEDLKAGMQFKWHRVTVEIIKIDSDNLEYLELGMAVSTTMNRQKFFDSLHNHGWQYVEKPLDQAMKKLDELYKINPHVPKVCKHTNIKGDTWFTSKIYKHCLDCGAALD